MDVRVLKQIGFTTVIGLVLAGAAAWRGTLTPGIMLFLLMVVAMTTIRAPHTTDPLPVSGSARDGREKVLVQLVAIGMMYLPAVAIATPLLDFAVHPNPNWVTGLGILFACLGLWLFWRSHADLDKNWSPVLELREGHGLVSGGVYARIRHPMYSAIYLIVGAQLAFLGNWVAGPAGLIAFTLLYLDRVGPEERLMAERFGTDYDRYVARTGRLVPKFGRARPGATA
ncbi:MAG: protein-S-isoprenylcysteine O-methyltransferase [Pseudomonadota bacterium]